MWHRKSRELYFFHVTREENHQFGAECLMQHRIDRHLREECLLVLGYHI